MMQAKIYYDFLTNEQKDMLRNILIQGPHLASEGVAPKSADKQRVAIGEKRFMDKFHRDPFSCPMNYFAEDVLYDRRTIAQRLDNDLAAGDADHEPATQQ